MKTPRQRPSRPSARRPAAAPRPDAPAFTPRPRARATTVGRPARQGAFLHALAASGCVDEAAQAVGMSARCACTLRARPDAGSFRQAWTVTLDWALDMLADAMIGRAIGVAESIFVQGEQIGENRRDDLAGKPRTQHPPLRTKAFADDPEAIEAQEAVAAAHEKAAE